jgi:hypothetical protein
MAYGFAAAMQIIEMKLCVPVVLGVESDVGADALLTQLLLQEVRVRPARCPSL